MAGLTEQVVTGKATFLATFDLERALLHWADWAPTSRPPHGAAPHEPALTPALSRRTGEGLEFGESGRAPDLRIVLPAK